MSEPLSNRDVLVDLMEWMQPPHGMDYCDAQLVNDAIKEIAAMRRCIRHVVDAYLLGDEYSEGHKQLVLSEMWYTWARSFLSSRAAEKAGGDEL